MQANYQKLIKILSYFNIDWKQYGTSICFPCPIHLGDNPRGLSIRIDSLYWSCWTRNCHQTHGNKIDGLVKALLQIKLNTEVDDKDIKDLLDKFQLDVSCSTFKVFRDTPDEILQYTSFKNIVQMPSRYFLNRGYSEECLYKFQVGACKSNNHEMSNRSVVPIFNLNNQLVGMTGRVHYKACDFCEEFHKPGLSCDSYHAPKWLLSKNFQKKKHLYNLNNIKNNDTVILVEGCCDVWKLYDCGIYNSAAMFGTSISNYHIKNLLSLNIQKIIIATNNDIAGIRAKEKLIDVLSEKFQIKSIDFPSKDLESLNKQQIQKIFGEYSCQKF